MPDAFYTPPTPLPDGKPGDLIRSQPFAASAGSKGYAILYRSTAVDGTPTAVSGIVYVPDAPVSGVRDVLAWAHGTTGLGDQCATSKQFESGTASEEAIASFATQQGYVFVATDYQGLGTPGPHPYLVNQAEGRNVLDAIRAAQRLPQSGATDASRAVVWGHSQGGGAAAFAAELKPTYAPELKLLGAVAGAPAADFAGTLAAAATSAGPNFGFAVMAVAGFAAAYPDVSEATLLTDKGRQVATRIQGECSDAILSELAATSPGELLQPAVATDAALAARLKENSAGYLKTDVPIWLYHGDADTTVPPSASKNMLDRYCAEGVNAARKVYPGADHTSVVLSAAADILTWIQARFRGQPAVSSC